MLITISNDHLSSPEGIPAGVLGEWVGRDRNTWSDETIDLRRHSVASCRRLLSALEPFVGLRGIRAATRNVKVWLEAAEKGVSRVKCRTLQQFRSLAYEWLQKAPRHWLYRFIEPFWSTYYVCKVEHVPASQGGNYYDPAHVNIHLRYRELDQTHGAVLRFELREVRGRTVTEVLAERGYVTETEELREQYEIQARRYHEVVRQVGRQFLARGYATDNLDGNHPASGDRDRWRSVESVYLDRDGEPAHVVVDIPWETKAPREDRDMKYDEGYWTGDSLLDADEDEELETIEPGEEEDDAAPMPLASIPINPLVPCFDLRRHLRLRIHVANLTEYTYDKNLGSRLILPPEVSDLVALLVSDKSEFRDIIKGKGGGAVILCAGPPGCGKTLTAEVYSEVMGRPLYSVQCSQLGLDAEALEAELLRVLARAHRWQAILLLDEADVYVAARGKDLLQNAIVGVFLRVLEYYSGVLFLTTNRGDSVDDAIASRCLARIDYQVPTPQDQARIWRVLSLTSGISVHPNTVDRIVEEFPRLSGRDVKQLLKLAGKIMSARGDKFLSLELVRFVKRFKPSPEA